MEEFGKSVGTTLGRLGIGVKNLGSGGENREAFEKPLGTVTGIFCLLDLAEERKNASKKINKIFLFLTQ